MKEYMLLIRNDADARAALTADKHLEFVKQCETYIGSLKKQGKLIAAQPLVREGVILSSTKEGWKEIPLKTGETTRLGTIIFLPMISKRPLK